MAYKANELAPLLRLGAWSFDPAQGTLLTDFQSGHGFTTSGADASSNVNDASQSALGSQCATVVSGGSGASAILLKTGISAIDTTNLQVILVLKCDDVTHLNSVSFSMANDSGFSNEYHVPFASAETSASGAWHVVTLSLGDAQSQGSPARTGITAIRVFHKDDNTGNKVTVHWQAIWLMPNAAHQPGGPFPNGIASITFDDGYATQQALARPYLDGYGYRASAYIIKDVINSPGHLTLAQIQAMQDPAGWEINSHAYTDADHTISDTALTAAQLAWDLSSQKEWLRVNGLNGQGFAYPHGNANPAVVAAAREWYRYARGTQGLTETYPAGDPYRLKSFSSLSEFSGGTAPSVISQAGGKIDQAVANASWLILTFHNIIPPAQSVTMSGNVATIVFSGTIPAQWAAASPVTLAGFTPSGLNGNFTIASVVNGTTITVNIGANPGNGTVMGTVVTGTTDCSYGAFTAIIDKLHASGIRVLPVAEVFTGQGAQSALQLDAVSADIQPVGVQAAGASGLAADARHVHPTTGLLALQAATAIAGYTLVNGTGTIISWTTPNDGAMHRVMISGGVRTTSTETGGAISMAYAYPDGSTSSDTLDAGGHSAGHNGFTARPLLVAPNTTVTVTQSGALTGGAAVAWAEVWGS